LAKRQTLSSNFAITHRYLLCDVMFRIITALLSNHFILFSCTVYIHRVRKKESTVFSA